MGFFDCYSPRKCTTHTSQRGGGGNVHIEKYGGHSKPQPVEGEKKEGVLGKLEDKVKGALGKH